jgi:hypothetical protein
MQSFHESISLQYHDTLNPKLWGQDDQLFPEVRSKLLEIAKAWMKYAGIPEINTHEIVFTGSNANYNYSSHSDIDIHIAVESEAVAPTREKAGEWFFDKFRLWKARYPNIRVRGYPVEIYAHDITEPFPIQQGVYSLVDGEWIHHPLRNPIDYESDTNLQSKVDYYTRLIALLVSKPGSSQAIRELKDQFFAGRTAGLSGLGENSIENLTYKELRNQGLIDALNDYLERENELGLSLESTRILVRKIRKKIPNIPETGEEYQPGGGGDFNTPPQPAPGGFKA